MDHDTVGDMGIAAVVRFTLGIVALAFEAVHFVGLALVEDDFQLGGAQPLELGVGQVQQGQHIVQGQLLGGFQLTLHQSFVAETGGDSGIVHGRLGAARLGDIAIDAGNATTAGIVQDVQRLGLVGGRPELLVVDGNEGAGGEGHGVAPVGMSAIIQD